VFSFNPTHLPLALRSLRGIAAISIGASTLIGIAWYIIRRPRPTPEEIERGRRDLLATIGRITDGTITDAPFSPDDPTHTPTLLIYDYRIAGVTYECAQDITTLANPASPPHFNLPARGIPCTRHRQKRNARRRKADTPSLGQLPFYQGKSIVIP
jgi:hypothetical protein